MLNEFYNDGLVHWYAYPFIYAVAICVFLYLSVRVGKAHLLRALRDGRVTERQLLSTRSILDATGIIVLLMFVASKFGGAFYSQPSAPIQEFLNPGSHEISSDWGMAAFAVVATFVPRRMRPLRELCQTWSALLLLVGSFGAIGCFCYGCCFGRPTQHDTWHAVQFPTRRNNDGAITGAPAVKEQMQLGLLSYDASRSLPVYPVQLYHFVLLFIGGVAAMRLVARSNSYGWPIVIGVYYMLVRVMLDPLRGDYQYGLHGNSLAPHTRIVFLAVLLVVMVGAGIRHAYARIALAKGR